MTERELKIRNGKMELVPKCPIPQRSDQVFIDDLNGRWYLVDNRHRGDWARFKKAFPKFEATGRHDGSHPDFVEPIYRNKPRNLTFIGAKIEEFT